MPEQPEITVVDKKSDKVEFGLLKSNGTLYCHYNPTDAVGHLQPIKKVLKEDIEVFPGFRFDLLQLYMEHQQALHAWTAAVVDAKRLFTEESMSKLRVVTDKFLVDYTKNHPQPPRPDYNVATPEEDTDTVTGTIPGPE